jgi:hypothetical protein
MSVTAKIKEAERAKGDRLTVAEMLAVVVENWDCSIKPGPLERVTFISFLEQGVKLFKLKPKQ